MISLPAALTRSLRAYAQPFASLRPEIFRHFPGGEEPIFPFGPDSDRGLGILLHAAALYRPGSESWTAKALAGVYRALGTDTFRLNRIPYAALQKALAAAEMPRPDPEEQKRAPGVLRSVCDFFYAAGPLGRWLETSRDWEASARELSAGIFWMGKHSRLRSKARYFFWLASFGDGFASRFPQARNFLWPVSDGHIRLYHGVLRPKVRKSFASPEAKLHWFSELGRELFPDQGWRLFLPLQAHLRPEPGNAYFCRKAWGGCRACPLAPVCPASKNFLSTETRA